MSLGKSSYSSRAGRWFHLVPTTAGETGGVESFARHLSAALVPVDSGDVLPQLCLGVDESSAALIDELPLGTGDGLLLHYVGYGYHRRGAPRWLSRAWERVRARFPRARFGVYFHEVAAFGPPWRSSFWLYPRQRSIARALLRSSDVAASSLSRYRRLLHRLEPRMDVSLISIPSTVGEPRTVPRLAQRSPAVVVFGSAGVRRRAYESEGAALERAIVVLDAEEIVDVGAGAVAPSTVSGVPVRATGAVSEESVSAELLRSRAGFVAYPPDFLNKSTIFAAYLAHGMVPICAWSGPRGRFPRGDEVWVGVEPNGLEVQDKLESVAARAFAAYSSRSLARHAEFWQRQLQIS